jgi:hypothetical protein
MDRTQVTISLKPVLESFLRQEFECESGPIMTTLKHRIGKYLYSKISTMDYPRKIKVGINPVTLLFPRQHDFHLEKFVFVTIEDQIDIQYMLTTEVYNLAVTYINKAITMDLSIKDGIYSFLERFPLRENHLNYEMIKKYYYRYRQKLEKLDVKKHHFIDRQSIKNVSRTLSPENAFVTDFIIENN